MEPTDCKVHAWLLIESKYNDRHMSGIGRRMDPFVSFSWIADC